jgi:hypothetical protein
MDPSLRWGDVSRSVGARARIQEREHAPMSGGFSFGNILLLLGLLCGVYGVVQLLILLRYRGPAHGRGTPGYARARDARRFAAWSIAAALLLLTIGAFAALKGGA